MQKLVRDKIPELIEADTGKPIKMRILDEQEYYQRLQDKLREEVEEYLTEPCQEELADICEVVEALAEVEGGLGQMRQVKKLKKKKKGGFTKRILSIY